MKGYSPKLPLHVAPEGGYGLTKTFKELSAQNLKMLILTSPGERVMDPSFGVGIYNYLFELNTQHTKSQVVGRINQQVRKYLPFIAIQSIDFDEDGGMTVDSNFLSVLIEYAIPSLNERYLLRISLD
jgi:phage baseplate assembly protein W